MSITIILVMCLGQSDGWDSQNRSEARTLLLTPQRCRLWRGTTSVGGCTSKHVFKSLRSQHGTCCSVWEAARNLWESLINAKNKHPGCFLRRQGHCVVPDCRAPLLSSGLPHQLRTLLFYTSQSWVHFKIIAGGCYPSGQLQSCYPEQLVNRVLAPFISFVSQELKLWSFGAKPRGISHWSPVPPPHPCHRLEKKIWAATAPITSLL